MTKLKVGDIFTEEVKLKSRKCFLVEMIESSHIICTDRDDKRKPKIEIKKPIKGSVAFLRNVNDKPTTSVLDIDLNKELDEVNDFGRGNPNRCDVDLM